jgi:hypothetical protein
VEDTQKMSLVHFYALPGWLVEFTSTRPAKQFHGNKEKQIFFQNEIAKIHLVSTPNRSEHIIYTYAYSDNIHFCA